MTAFVVDASAVLAAVFPDETDEGRPDTLTLLQSGEAVAPSLWPAEVANGLFQAIPRQRMAWAGARIALSNLSVVKVELVSFDVRDMQGAILPLAQRHSLTAYDSLYLHLALSHEISLRSNDSALRRAAQKEGVSLT